MTISYNRTGADRRPLIAAISTITGADAKYLGAPTFAYQVGSFTIDRSGEVTFGGTDSTAIENLIEQLHAMGFDTEPVEKAAPIEAAATSMGEAAHGLTIQMPAASFTPVALTNLTNLLAAKGQLIRKALGVTDLPVETGSDVVSFPWFSGEVTGEEVKAYTHLVTALCDMARNQKRITAREKDADNEKYAFRCFLLRLGFIGAEYKEERKILLRNLAGNGAFKSGRRSTEAIQPEPPSPAAQVEAQGDPTMAEAMADELLIQQVNASFDEQ